MKTTITMTVLILLAISAVPTQAEPAQGAMSTVCAPPYDVVTTPSIGEGTINFCVYYPLLVLPGSSFYITSTLTAPPTVNPSITTSANAFLAQVGCTETGPPATIVPTTNGVVGTMWTAVSLHTMTSEQCDVVATVSLTVGATPVQIYLINMPIAIQTENMRLDNFNYLCDAPAISPNAYSTTLTTCNDPNLIVSGTLDMGSDVDVHNNVTVFSNVTVNENVTVQPGNQTTGEYDLPVYVLVLALSLFLIWMGENRGLTGSKVFGAILLMVTAGIAIWQAERLGFNEAPGLLIPYVAFTVMLGGYWLAKPLFKENDDKPKVNQ